MGQIQFLFSLIRRSGVNSKHLLRASIIAGALQGLLLYVMSSSIEELATTQSVSFRNFLLFTASLFGLYKSLSVSMGLSSTVARELVTGFEVRIAEKISHTSYAHFKGLEQGAIYDAITGSKDIINESAIMLPVFISSLTMLACSLVFSAFISVAGLIAVLLVMGGGAIIFFYSDKRFIAALMTYRESVAAFQTSLKDVIQGFNELKMNEQRRKAFFNKVIEPLSREVIAKRVTTDRHRVQNTVMYGLMVYFPVGALLFVLPQTGLMDIEQSVKIVAITLFSTIPLIGLLSFMPMAARSAIIVQGLEAFESSLDLMRDDTGVAPETTGRFTGISIEKACYAYPNSNGGVQPFTVAVDSFRLDPGELVILRGGNGSGKSTFMRVLAGLERFTSGDIMLNGSPAAELGAAFYRSFFSILLPDFHLFGGLYGMNASPERVRSLLDRMALSGKVRYDAETGRFSNVLLSSGQRKRLALICVILENRPVMLFDEVAADFDHHFRDVFYKELLPELKAEGRTILVISHDDRYFSVADRVLTLRYGKFVQDREVVAA